MARTLADVVAAARAILNDTVEQFRYPDVDLYNLITEAVAEARRARPDLFVGRLFVPLPAYVPADAPVAFPLDDAYFTPVVNYVVGRAELRDDETGTSRASGFITSFQGALRTAAA